MLFLTLLACNPETDDTADTTDTADTSDTGDTVDSTDTGVEVLPDDFEAELGGPSGGCSDVTMYSANTGDTVALFFQSSGQARAACEAGTPLVSTWTLPDAAVTLRVEQGSELASNMCDDAPMGTPEVRRTWNPTSGTLTLTLQPDPDGQCSDVSADAELVLTDVVFTADDGAGAVTAEALTLTAHVGWLPG